MSVSCPMTHLAEFPLHLETSRTQSCIVGLWLGQATEGLHHKIKAAICLLNSEIGICVEGSHRYVINGKRTCF